MQFLKTTDARGNHLHSFGPAHVPASQHACSPLSGAVAEALAACGGQHANVRVNRVPAVICVVDQAGIVQQAGVEGAETRLQAGQGPAHACAGQLLPGGCRLVDLEELGRVLLDVLPLLVQRCLQQPLLRVTGRSQDTAVGLEAGILDEDGPRGSCNHE